MEGEGGKSESLTFTSIMTLGKSFHLSESLVSISKTGIMRPAASLV